MPRYRILVEYHGGRFHGWQRQVALPTVQAALEAAIAAVCRETVTVTGAGRTDSGVHATGQVAHFDLERSWPPGRLRDAINSQLLASGAAVLAAEAAPDGFHARFGARRRRYRYRMVVRRAPLAVERGLVWRRGRELDVAAMQAAAAALAGRHDFTTFRAAACQGGSPVRTLDRLDVIRSGDRIDLVAVARSFLQHQVRGMVGTLERVGAGAWSPQQVAAALAARDRAACGPVAPPEGLYLERVEYEGESVPEAVPPGHPEGGDCGPAGGAVPGEGGV